MRPPIVIYWYVHYDDSGKVYAVSNVESQEHKNFAIDRELIKDFMFLGKKKAEFYKIEYFYNLSKGFIEYEQEQKVVQNNIPYVIPRAISYNNEITLEHNSKNRSWKMIVRDDVKDKMDLSSSLAFFICKKDNPHILYSTLFCNKDSVGTEIPFKTNIEITLNDFSLITNRRFNSYGIKEIE